MLYTIEAANRLIADGRWRHIAGDASTLARLARGNWIGGTIPYFLTDRGGCADRERVFVTDVATLQDGVSIDWIAPDRLADIPANAPAHGYSLVVMPAGSEVHRRYAIEAPDLSGLFETPIIGWVAGVHLDELGRSRAQVYDGRRGECADDRIAVLRARLPESCMAQIGIINLFRQGGGDVIRFPAAGFEAGACWVNDQPASIYDYARSCKLDLRLPLVADMSGEMINVSFQALDDAGHAVRF